MFAKIYFSKCARDVNADFKNIKIKIYWAKLLKKRFLKTPIYIYMTRQFFSISGAELRHAAAWRAIL
jgi:hypothetical protein